MDIIDDLIYKRFIDDPDRNLGPLNNFFYIRVLNNNKKIKIRNVNRRNSKLDSYLEYLFLEDSFEREKLLEDLVKITQDTTEINIFIDLMSSIAFILHNVFWLKCRNAEILYIESYKLFKETPLLSFNVFCDLYKKVICKNIPTIRRVGDCSVLLELLTFHLKNKNNELK